MRCVRCVLPARSANNYSTRGSPYVHLILLAHLSTDICQWAHVREGEPFARDIPTVCKYECEPTAGLTATDSECELNSVRASLSLSGYACE